MVLLCLVVVAHEDVRREATVRDNPADGGHTVHIPLTGVLAVHQFQDLIAAALYGQVDMLAHVGHLGNHLQRLVAHILRVACGEPHAHGGYLLRHHPQQLWKGNVLVSLSPCLLVSLKKVRIHILPQERYFLKTTISQVAHLAQDALHVATALTASGIGHDAVVAEVVAATHDTHETSNLMPQSDTLWHYVLIGLSRREFDVHRLVARLRLCDQVRQTQVGIRSGHQVTVVVLQQILLRPLGHTA